MGWDFFEEVSDKKCSSCGDKFPVDMIKSYYGKDYCPACYVEEKRLRKQQKAKSKSKKGNSSSVPGQTTPQQTPSDKINAKIGGLKVSINQEMLDEILKKIWNLDEFENPALDDVLKNEFEKLALQSKLKLDTARIFKAIEDSAFFTFFDESAGGKETTYSFQEWQREFKNHTGVGNQFEFPRTEFSQFLKNKFKNHWVKHDGTRFTDEEFQVLVRAYRERKAIERLLNYMEDDYFSYVETTALSEFLRQMRMIISKVIKDELLEIK